MFPLSCYIANLAAYLASELPDAGAHIARSVRLAVRTDLPDGELAFSHHHLPLDRMPDGTRLRYATGDFTAALAAHGRVLVVTDNARLPWSPSYGTTFSAPHWLLVEGRDDDGLLVSDAFSGLLPGGEQQAFTGRLCAADLAAAMTPANWSPAQRRRNELAFGFPVPPGSGPQWLRRERGDVPTAELPGEWLTDSTDALRFLAGYFVDQGAAADRHLDDLWTAARHHAFAYRWRASHGGDGDAGTRFAEVADAWEKLPGALRFAVDSARRGRPRQSLVRTTFDHLLELEMRVTRKEAG